jgi:energy-coupling factor transporter transmembrane protein EcfT
MKWVLYVLIFIILLLIILAFSKLKVKINIMHTGDDDHFKVTMQLWRFIRYTIDVPLIQVDEEDATVVMKQKKYAGKDSETASNDQEKRLTPKKMIKNMKKMQKLVNRVIGFHEIVKKFVRHITIHQLNWKSSFGTGDAAHTGVLTGVIWSLKGSIVGLLSHYMQLRTKPQLEVVPQFQKLHSETHLLCMISFRIGHTMFAAIRTVKYWKPKKGGKKQHVRTSDSGLDDNGYGKLKAND